MINVMDLSMSTTNVNYNNAHEGDFSRAKKKSFYWYKHVIETNGEEL